MPISKGHVIYRARIDGAHQLAITKHTVRSVGKVYATVDPRISFSGRISLASAEKSATNEIQAIEMLLKSMARDKDLLEQRLSLITIDMQMIEMALNNKLHAETFPLEQESNS